MAVDLAELDTEQRGDRRRDVDDLDRLGELTGRDRRAAAKEEPFAPVVTRARPDIGLAERPDAR
jgi:hypothetical protein